ncbi:hypothetical protein EZL74_03250 [Flavobacterium silvisoli]|uniref:Uncharacterized protein n=1 Tax=Flavobacterium silvisoli TaxID=2529433 RepID=A0A4Q9Z2U3_9FLAO|nr:hypothetical protein [Flavobacterium silvisoli]TBX70703.1 hypothetical protein EZL74_03250 [Flavobacterium silvisoli]
MKKIILLAFIAFSVNSHAQLLGKLKEKMAGKSKLELYPEEKLDMPQYQNHIGQVCFSNDEFERTLPEDKYIKTYTFGDKLSMRAWFANSPANSMMLQLEESGKKAKEINENRNPFEYQSKILFVLYLDGQKVTNTSYAFDFKREDMFGLATHRAEFNDGTDDLYFGESLMMDLKRKQDLLTPGTHKLKIEVVPFKTAGYGSEFDYKPIAVGEIDMIVKNTPIDKNDPDACLPKAKMVDKALEAKILLAYKNRNLGGTAKEVRIISDRWYIAKHQYTGVPLRRTVTAVIGKTKDGKCSRDEYSFAQDYDGSTYQNEVYLYGEGIGTEREISCKCLSK